MLQRAISCLFVVFLSLSAVSAVYAEARGPKIFGFQVGMPWDEAVKVAKAYAEKHNLKFENGKFNNYNDKFKMISVEGDFMLSSPESSSYLLSISFYPKLFKIKDFNGYIEKIFDRYGLSADRLVQIDKDNIGYSNIDDGYKVELRFFGGRIIWLKLSMIDKQSDIHFE